MAPLTLITMMLSVKIELKKGKISIGSVAKLLGGFIRMLQVWILLLIYNLFTIIVVEYVYTQL